jgi:formylglycine-generating enzyme required for sulfatase activity
MLLLMLLFWPGGSKPPANKSTDTTQGNQKKTKPTASKTLPAKAAVAPPLAVAPFDTAQAKAHQQAWSKHLGVPIEYTNSIGMKFMLIPPGEFMMGSPESEEGRRPDEVLHRVRLTRPFYLASCEVTQDQYSKVMETNPSSSKGDHQPVEVVSWQATAGFLHLLSSLPKERKGEQTYRLPTEAEWEYACRAGTTSRFSFGNSIDEFPEYSWPVKDLPKASKDPHPVGQKLPNAWKLYDLHANVSEWCQDYYSAYPGFPVTDPQGPLTGSIRVRRGGGHMHGIIDCRSASRLSYGAKGKENLVGSGNLGFRVVLEIPFRAQPDTIAAKTKSLPPSLQQGLVAYYPFNGNANDESGNGHHGEVHGAVPSPDRHGNTDQAYLFDGVNDGIQITESASLGPRLITLSAWMRTNSLGTLFYKARFQDAVAEQYALHISLPESGKQFPSLRFSIKRNSNGRPGFGWQRAFSRDHVNTNNWMMVTATFDGLAQRIYINGELNGINDMESLGESGIDDLAGNTLQIGQGWSVDKRYFNGSLDDIRIYNRALSAAEVKALYEFEKP